MGLLGPEAAAGGPSCAGRLGGVWNCEPAGVSIGAGWGGHFATIPEDSAPGLSTLPTSTVNQPFNTTLQLSGTSVPSGLGSWSAPVTPQQQSPMHQTPALPACNGTRLYDDPAGPAVRASGPSHDGGSSSAYPCWEVHESALLSPHVAPAPMQPPAAEPAHGGGPPGPWAESDGRPLPGAGGSPGISLGAARGADRLHTPDARGTAAGGSGLQMRSPGRLFPCSPSAVAVGVASLPVEATVASARYCI